MPTDPFSTGGAVVSAVPPPSIKTYDIQIFIWTLVEEVEDSQVFIMSLFKSNNTVISTNDKFCFGTQLRKSCMYMLISNQW